MASSIYFIQPCPTCGRRLQVRVEYLGKKVVCQHCQAAFLAADPANQPLDCGESGSALLRRADQLLASLEQRTHLDTPLAPPS